MFSAKTAVSQLQDINTLENVPLEQQLPFQNTYELFTWAAETYRHQEALRFLPSVDPDAPIESYSYTELFHKITQTANLFLSLTPDSPRVSFLLPNLPETHFTLWGAEASGVVNALNPMLEADTLASLMNQAGSEVLVTTGPSTNTGQWRKVMQLSRQVNTLSHIVIVGPEEQHSELGLPLEIQVHNFRQAIASQDPNSLLRPRHIKGSDIASCFHTGGTTGTPKIARHTHFNEVANAWSAALMMPGKPGDVCLVGLPLFHVNAVIGTGLSSFLKGHTVVLATPGGYRTPGMITNFWALVEKHRATTFSCVPTILSSLLNEPVDDRDISSLAFAICGAAPLSRYLLTRFEAETGAKVLEGYGLTEAGCVSTLNPPAGERKPGSIGIRLPFQQLRIAQVSHQNTIAADCAVNETGTLLVKGPNVFPGYLQSRNNQGVLLEDGWLNTGDLARIDEQGYIWLTGRAKDLIIRGGHNIDPGLIEEALIKHPAVTGVAAVGQPDAYAGELPCAYLTLKQGKQVSVEELTQFARSQIQERAACPVYLEVIQQLPLTAVGKPFKPALRCKAAHRVLAETLEKQGIKADIQIHQDQRRGMVAIIKTASDPELVKQTLGGFTLPIEIETTNEPITQ